MKTRHVASMGLLGLALAVAPNPASGQEDTSWRTRFAAGEEARAAGDDERYAREMAAAATAMPDGHLNRPFVQYHAARAAARIGDVDGAVAWLDAAWDEDIEAVMISFAAYDPAFDRLAGDADFEALMARPASMTLSRRRLAPGVELLQGAGSNVLVAAGDDGALLVDTGYGPALPALRSAVSAAGYGPIRWVVLTHPHEDHMGATPELGPEATVVAHPGTTAAMREPYVFMEGVTLPPKPETAEPDLEIARDTTLLLGGVALRVRPTVAHTGGDLSVYLPDAKVAHLGDTYLSGNPMMYPGTSDPDGFLDALDDFLDDMDPETVVVGGHDDVVDLDTVRDQMAVTREAMAFVRRALEEGRTVEETAQAAEGRFPAPWIAFLYRTLGEGGA